MATAACLAGLQQRLRRGDRTLTRPASETLRSAPNHGIETTPLHVIVVHSLGHAVAALRAASELRQPVMLASAPGAGIYAGPGWFRELVAAAREAVPEAQSTAVLDCGDDAGAAQGAIRAGVEAILFTGRADVAARLADIAAQCGARLLTERPVPALDFAELFFAAPDVLHRRCAEVLRRMG